MPKTKEKPTTRKSNVSLHFTDDLTQFSLLEGNRPTNKLHVDRIRKSIQKNGMLIAPIITDELRRVIDGQHRLLAAIEEGVGIYYIIAVGYGVEEVHILNQNQKNWKAEDFLNCYADMGYKHYVSLREFWQAHDFLPLTACIALCGGMSANMAMQRQRTEPRSGVHKFYNKTEVFQYGTWEVRRIEPAKIIANYLREIGQYYKGYTRASFINAIIWMNNHPNFDFPSFIRKLKIQQSKMIDCTNVTSYKALIEEIYNWKRQKKVSLRY